MFIDSQLAVSYDLTTMEKPSKQDISKVMSELARRSNAKQDAQGRTSEHFREMAKKSWEARRKKPVENS